MRPGRPRTRGSRGLKPKFDRFVETKGLAESCARFRGRARVLMPEEKPCCLLVCGLPESGRLRVQRREGQPTTLRDVYGAPELLYATPPPPSGAKSGAGLAPALPHLCMPDGVAFCDESPPPPPRFFTTSLPGGGGDGTASAYLSCCLYFEEIPAEHMLPLLTHAINHQAGDSPSGSVPRTPPHTPPHATTDSPVKSPSASTIPAAAGTAQSAVEQASQALGDRPRDVASPCHTTSAQAEPSPSCGGAPGGDTEQVQRGGAVRTSQESRKRREDAMKTLRGLGIPLGVCAVALRQVRRTHGWPFASDRMSEPRVCTALRPLFI